MNQQSGNPERAQLVLSSFIFGNREFRVEVRHDGFSYWFDSVALNDAQKANPDLIVKAAANLQPERQFLEYLMEEYTLRAKVQEVEMKEVRETLSDLFWLDDTPDWVVTRIDEILEPIFWREINPQLSPMIER